MTFTVEDGSIVAEANAYITVAFMQSFHETRGKDLSAFDDEGLQQAIVQATDYVDKRFGVRFVGRKRDREQSLQWPRLSAWTNQRDYINSDVVPLELKRAVAEYAFLALYLTLLPVPAPSFNSVDPVTGETTVAQGGLLQRDRQKVGPIEEEKWFNQEQWRLVLQNRASGAQSDVVSTVNLPEYPAADEWLKPIIKTGMSISLSRG